MCGSRTTRKHPFQLKKKSQALRLSLHDSAAITLEIGSRFFVEPSQEKYRLSGRYFSWSTVEAKASSSVKHPTLLLEQVGQYGKGVDYSDKSSIQWYKGNAYAILYP